MSSVAKVLGLPPGVHFRPDEDELVECYLLPRARGEPPPFPGVAVVDDDAAGSTLPWELLHRHGRGADEEAYFFARTSGDGEARQDRACDGGGSWKSQKRHMRGGRLRVDAGEKEDWSRHNLNLHMGRGESGGSVGWVMHEYILTDPSWPPLKICHVSFTGHGKNRKRVPDGVDDGQSEPAPKRVRVVAAAGGSASCGSGSTTTTVDQDTGAVLASADHDVLSEIENQLLSEEIRGLSFRASSADAERCYQELLQEVAAPTTEQQVTEHVMMMPMPLMVQETAGMLPDHLHQCGGGESMGVTPTPDELCNFVDWEGYRFYC